MANSRLYILSLLMIFLAFFSIETVAQPTRITLTNNFVVPGDTSFKLIPKDYNFKDTEANGVIQIIGVSNVTIDMDSSRIMGIVDSGYAIYIENSSNITIKNAKRINDYFYGVYVKNSQNINIDSNFFWNAPMDSFAIINIFEGADKAHGGGVFIDSCRLISIKGNIMNFNNDGIAAYNSSTIFISRNDLSHNTGFGVRLFNVDSSAVEHNNVSETYRYTGSAVNAAGILGVYCQRNLIDSNYGITMERGVYLNDFNNLQSGNNLIRNNIFEDISHVGIGSLNSMDNRIESNTLGICDQCINLSRSLNIIVDSNTITRGKKAAVYISHSRGISFKYNSIDKSRRAVWLNELFSPLPPYDYPSAKHNFQFNIIKECTEGFILEHTDSSMFANNQFSYNLTSFVLDSTSAFDTIWGSAFYRSADFHIHNKTDQDLIASNNSFFVNDSSIISEYIYDNRDSVDLGIVNWGPTSGGATPTFSSVPSSDLCEKPAEWRSYSADGNTAYAYLDTGDRHEELQSVHLINETKREVRMHYWPKENDEMVWDLGKKYGMTFFMKTTNIDSAVNGSLSFRLRDHSSGGYYEYSMDSTIFTLSRANYRLFYIPFEGDSLWKKDSVGVVSFSHIQDLDVIYQIDDNDCHLYFDGMHILPELNASTKTYLAENSNLRLFPNPSSNKLYYYHQNEGINGSKVEIYNIQGVLIHSRDLMPTNELQSGVINTEAFSNGIYLFKIGNENETITRKLVIQH